MKTNYHIHTVFCDGKNTPEEMVAAAVASGFDEIGISEHAPIFFDQSEGMAQDRVEEYCETVGALKEKYKGTISVLCGVERDIFCSDFGGKFDYVIGSEHYVKVEDEYFVLDWTPEKFTLAAEKCGGYIELCERYYSTFSHVVEITNCDIIGHIDLVTKFNEEYGFYDEENPRYIKAVKNALDALCAADRYFEINTGAISRGYRTTPYPSAFIMRELARRGSRAILSGDSHRADTLDCAFDEALEIAKSCSLKVEDRLIIK